MSSFPFLRLPRELRNRIYHFALLNQRARFYARYLKLEAHYFFDSSEHSSLNATDFRWLHTSHQILSEGLDHFYLHAKLAIYSVDSHVCYVERTIDGYSSIFNLGKIKTAELNLRMGEDFVKREGKWYSQLVPRSKERSYKYDEDFSELSETIQRLEHCSLETLKLTVWLFETKDYKKPGRASADESHDSDDSYSEGYWNSYGYNLAGPEDNDGYLVEFEFLKKLGSQWKNVQIEYIPTYMLPRYGDADPVPANIVVVPMIQYGLVEIAKYLVGGEGWTICDGVEDLHWVLEVKRRPVHERTQKVEHLGLKKYLAECDNCHEKEEIFVLQPDEGDDMYRFVAYETPTIRGAM
ncbi:hypothetical protein N0V90_012452 [Kalmusia sp. IMI 367209]|nr:hypothetical protein N0V90_012452 [Kalmusia sp. IMI 367209]